MAQPNITASSNIAFHQNLDDFMKACSFSSEFSTFEYRLEIWQLVAAAKGSRQNN
jgi:hypothetical protein